MKTPQKFITGFSIRRMFVVYATKREREPYGGEAEYFYHLKFYYYLIHKLFFPRYKLRLYALLY